MTKNLKSLSHLYTFMVRPEFILLDAAGIACTVAEQFAPTSFKTGFLGIGMGLLTLGLTLPISLFHLLSENAKTLGILRVCATVGIKDKYENRRDHRYLAELDDALNSSVNIDLLGVALKSILNPEHKYSPLAKALDNPKICLRVLLLDPGCQAAMDRAASEQSNTTIADIKKALHYHVPNILLERMKAIEAEYPDLKEQMSANVSEWSDELMTELTKKLNVQVRLYNSNPEAHIMCFRDSVFVEPYHRGRADDLLRQGSCLGGNVEITEYDSSARTALFFKAHYDTVWGESRERDLTRKLIVGGKDHRVTDLRQVKARK